MSNDVSCALDEQTLSSIYGKEVALTLVKGNEYNTNNGWVNFRDKSGQLRAMPFSREVAEMLSNLGYKSNSKIGVIDANVILDIKKRRQEGGNAGFASGLESDILRVFKASQDKAAARDGKYSV